VLYRVNLGKPLAAQASTKIQVKMVFTHVMTPFPAKISQNEKQLVRYYDNHYFFSPYTVQTQTTTVHLPSSHIEKKSELNPTSVRGETITYGPYEDVKPFSVSPMELHFENNKPFITITK
jgi:oligosaccharyltransferase complex subunit alpha (ribophorin I)